MGCGPINIILVFRKWSPSETYCQINILNWLDTVINKIRNIKYADQNILMQTLLHKHFSFDAMIHLVSKKKKKKRENAYIVTKKEIRV